MGIVGKVVHGGAVPEMDVVDHAELFEILEEPVHRRLVHVR